MEGSKRSFSLITLTMVSIRLLKSSKHYRTFMATRIEKRKNSTASRPTFSSATIWLPLHFERKRRCRAIGGSWRSEMIVLVSFLFPSIETSVIDARPCLSRPKPPPCCLRQQLRQRPPNNNMRPLCLLWRKDCCWSSFCLVPNTRPKSTKSRSK